MSLVHIDGDGVVKGFGILYVLVLGLFSLACGSGSEGESSFVASRDVSRNDSLYKVTIPLDLVPGYIYNNDMKVESDVVFTNLKTKDIYSVVATDSSFDILLPKGKYKISARCNNSLVMSALLLDDEDPFVSLSEETTVLTSFLLSKYVESESLLDSSIYDYYLDRLLYSDNQLMELFDRFIPMLMTSDYSDYLFDLSWMHNFHNDLLSEGLLVTTSYAILFDEITYIEGFGLMESLVSRMRYDGYWLAISDDVSANSVMRAEVIKLIVNLSGYPIYAANPPSFADVPPSHPYYNYVETALWYGFIDPTPFFEPERSVTSEEFLNYFYL